MKEGNMSAVEEKLRGLGLTLPSPSPPVGNYIPGVRTGNLVFLAGVGPRTAEGEQILGKVGRDLTVEQAYEAARRCALALLGNLKGVIGDLDRVTHVVKVLGMVNAVPEFTDHPKVINGCSDLLVALFGEKGRHARAAVGMGSLPSGIAVEIEMVVEVAG
jgi:enamine deaminase RidA (YjgF/YER057c/UK114 family)